MLLDYRQVGIDAFNAEDYETAIESLETATLADRDDFRAFTYLGAAYAQVGRYNSAIGAFKHASALKPDVAKVHYNLAQAYEAAGVPAEAWFSYKKALEIDPYYQPAKTALILLGSRMTMMREQRLQLAV